MIIKIYVITVTVAILILIARIASSIWWKWTLFLLLQKWWGLRCVVEVVDIIKIISVTGVSLHLNWIHWSSWVKSVTLTGWWMLTRFVIMLSKLCSESSISFKIELMCHYYWCQLYIYKKSNFINNLLNYIDNIFS